MDFFRTPYHSSGVLFKKYWINISTKRIEKQEIFTGTARRDFTLQACFLECKGVVWGLVEGLCEFIEVEEIDEPVASGGSDVE